MPAIVAGLSKLTAQLERVGYQFTVEDLVMGANVILDEAQALCPVDTGYLQSTGFIQAVGNDVQVGFEAPYASYVEFGTYKMAAQPFLRPALDNAETAALEAIVDSIESHFRSGIGGGGAQTQAGPGTLQP